MASTLMASVGLMASLGFVAFVGIMASPGLSAERSAVLSLRRFELLDRLSAMDQSSEADFYLRGISDGLAFANAALEGSGKARLFCANVPTDVPELRRMLREQITFLDRIGQKSEQAMERTAAVAIVLQKLREKYPCR
ncbi:hypothetical protein [Methylobacterium sp. J-090]|uniref:hypothetical protein n=1 Tax=Methylobacterium sp. J-090 TaxID=2836666 RepID=UPI001FBAFB19|nr:hypothetical protein [Methylobacterium sp. J-090]MCJ2083793.1 hypothetical protein [Methylobacterium sp. J-090]